MRKRDKPLVSSRKRQCFGVRKLRFASFKFPLKTNPHPNNLRMRHSLRVITGLNRSFSSKGDLGEWHKVGWRGVSVLKRRVKSWQRNRFSYKGAGDLSLTLVSHFMQSLTKSYLQNEFKLFGYEHCCMYWNVMINGTGQQYLTMHHGEERFLVQNLKAWFLSGLIKHLHWCSAGGSKQ